MTKVDGLIRTVQVKMTLVTEKQLKALLKGRIITLRIIGKVRWPVGCLSNADQFPLRDNYIRLEIVR